MVYSRKLIRRIRIVSPYRDASYLMPTFYERIDKQIRSKLVTLIIIDGKAQTGKSTLARSICEHYCGKEYKRFYTIQEILDYLKGWAKKIIKYNPDGSYYLDQKELDQIQNRWLLFEEPQLEASRQEYWSERNLILQSITSSYGFLHNPLIMTLPNIKGITDMVMTNISLRITVRAWENSLGNMVRKAYIRLPEFNEMKNKWYWTTVQHHTIPFIEADPLYNAEKAHNFFVNQLDKWNNSLIFGKKSIENTPYCPKELQ